MAKKEGSGAGALVGILLFLLFTAVVEIWRLRGLNLWATTFTQSIVPRLLDTPFSVLSVLGTAEVTSLILLLMVWVIKGLRPYWLFLFFGFGVVIGTETLMKYLVANPSPPAIYYRYDLPVFLPLSQVEAGYSYPSGHMGRATYLLVIIGMVIGREVEITKRRPYYVMLISLWILMAISRIYLGEHWLTDVVGGTLLGEWAGWMSFRVGLSHKKDLKRWLNLPLDS